MNAIADTAQVGASSDYFIAPNGMTYQRSKLYVDGMGNVIAKLYAIDKQADADATDHLMAYYLDHNLIAATNVPGVNNLTVGQVESFCANLTHAGFSDWDNPEIHQGVLLNDYTKEDPCVDTSVHPGITGGAFWTKRQTALSLAEGRAGSSRSFWCVYMRYGYVGDDSANLKFRARPVRVASPAGQ